MNYEQSQVIIYHLQRPDLTPTLNHGTQIIMSITRVKSQFTADFNIITGPYLAYLTFLHYHGTVSDIFSSINSDGEKSWHLSHEVCVTTQVLNISNDIKSDLW